ncbi:hypothetical protein TEA_028919 [Camellia sinensis var. sinensis]|uniref:NAD(P)-binding domain-containing protein n=1 Tax=Camellia sinensis var. sinensis TaxID=542762 RepID=A0A4S4EHQ5_CAMSN|nr:hypothetical protein TEA_028919 [Camellia sinensis var. sinensis]
MPSVSGQTVCVTGAGGFIASWMVKLLLQKGYTVRGTVRNPDDPKNSHLRQLEGAEERLTLCKSDLLDYQSLREAIDGCDGVFHTASPVTDDPFYYGFCDMGLMAASVFDLKEEMVEPAVNGTKNVIIAAAEVKVRRVVFTSSIGAVTMDPNRSPDAVVDESCWSDLEFCKSTKMYRDSGFHLLEQERLDPLSGYSKRPLSSLIVWWRRAYDRETGDPYSGYPIPLSRSSPVPKPLSTTRSKHGSGSSPNWYCYGKAVAEQAASNEAKERGVDLVVVNPVLVLGPLLQPTLNASIIHVLKYLNGSAKTYANSVQAYVDVKDVALAHILVFENPSASGRYLCAESVLHRGDVVEILAKLFPEYPIPTKCKDETKPRIKPYKFSNQKLKDLGLEFTPVRQSLYDTVKSLQEKGHLPIHSQHDESILRIQS